MYNLLELRLHNRKSKGFLPGAKANNPKYQCVSTDESLSTEMSRIADAGIFKLIVPINK
jgi:hypothetical protein